MSDTVSLSQPMPEILLVVPVLNEEDHIRDCLSSLLPQALALDAEIWVMDGGSTDATAAIVREMAAEHGHIALVDNRKKLQSAAVNLAAQIAPPSVRLLVRADAHAHYPADFLSLCVRAVREHNATSVVVPMRTVSTPEGGGMQRAIAALQNSRLGNGGAAHRAGGVSGYVDHGHHAVFDRRFFQSIGGYDESFSHNEDAEHDIRAVAAGGAIWMCREAAMDYIPRSALWPLARQYFRHGQGRVRTLLRHRLIPKPRQMAAPGVVALSLLSILLLPVSLWFALMPLLYLGACLAWAAAAAWRSRDPWMLGMAPAAVAVHAGWGCGFFAGLARYGLSGGPQADMLPAIAPSPLPAAGPSTARS